MTVDDVESDEQRYAETGLLDRETLHLPHVRGAHHVEQIADRAILDRLGRIAGDDGAGHRIARRRHRQLAELLGKGHPGDQGIEIF
jgi:hypothetical protein